MKTIKDSPLRRAVFSFGILLATLCLCGLPLAARAQGSMASATFTSTAVGNGTYNYNLTLNNIGSTDIGTFWFAWIPGYDFLPSNPNSISPPAGWSYLVESGYYGGYSIEFMASTPLAPGSSLSGFDFNSSDTPGTMSGISPEYPGGYRTATSYTYSGAAFSDAGFMFVAQPVPEPSTTALVVGGLVLLLFLVRPRARKLS